MTRNVKIVKKVLLFNDIKGSSKLWRNYPSKMFSQLEQMFKVTKKLLKTHKGMIVKFLGDSFMISFDSLEPAIRFSIEINAIFANNPLYLNKTKGDKIEFRTGICFGNVSQFKFNIQSCNQKDYFGNVANTASRMESKVSRVNGVAIGLVEQKNSDVNTIVDIVNSYPGRYRIENTLFTSAKCPQKDHKRSSKLLHDLNFSCKDLDELKGVNEVLVVNLIPL